MVRETGGRKIMGQPHYITGLTEDEMRSRQEIIYRKGDMVEYVADRSGWGFEKGMQYEVLEDRDGKGHSAMVSLKGSNRGHGIWWVNKADIILAGGCGKCVYSCKAKDICPLYTEVTE